MPKHPLLSKIKSFLADPLGSKLAATSTSAPTPTSRLSSPQDQSAAGGSTALQAGRDITIQAGLSHAEVRQTAMDVFDANFYKLAGIARQTAHERAEEVAEAFLRRLEATNPGGLSQANDPGFLASLYTVQKEHAKTGDKDLSELLVDLLVDRTKQGERNILQIVLDESLRTAPKLTEGQLANLAVIFQIRYTVTWSNINHEQLGAYFDERIQPFASKLTKNSATFQHLEFTGCGSILQFSQQSLESMLASTYQGLFLSGVTMEEVGHNGLSIENHQGIFITCLNDPNKLQVRALNHEQLDKTLADRDFPEVEKSKIRALFDRNKMSEEAIRAKCITIRPYMEAVFNTWMDSSMGRFSLTSVGIAIGHANVKRVIGKEFANLSIWIN